MIYVSLVEVLHESMEKFEKAFEGNVSGESSEKSLDPGQKAVLCATSSFFIGWAIALGMDALLHKFMDVHKEGNTMTPNPDSEESLVATSNPDCCPPVEAKYEGPRVCDEERQAQMRFEADNARLIQVGWFTALALTLHNIPEGLLTYVSSLSENPGTGLGIACAIGLHNIPEG